MTNRDLAEKIYEDLNKRGAALGNASIRIIRKTLDDNGVKNCSIPDVVVQSEQLVDFCRWYNQAIPSYETTEEEIVETYLREIKINLNKK